MSHIKWTVGIGALLIAGLVYSQTRVATDPQAFIDELMQSVLSPDSPPPLNLPLVASNAIPESATFWSAQANADSPPYPFNPVADLGLPIYSLGNNSFLFGKRHA